MDNGDGVKPRMKKTRMERHPPRQREGEGNDDDDNATAGRMEPMGWQ
jgi:hypothetical protein